MAGWHLEIGRFPNAWEGFTIRKDVDMNQMLVETHRVSWEFGDLRWDDSKAETIPKHKKNVQNVPVNIQPRIGMLSHRQLQVSWCYNADSVCSELSPSTLHRAPSVFWNSPSPSSTATVTRHPKNHHFLHLLSAWYDSSPPIIGSLLPVMVLDILKRSKQS